MKTQAITVEELAHFVAPEMFPKPAVKKTWEKMSGVGVPFYSEYRWWVAGTEEQRLVVWGPRSPSRMIRDEALMASGRSAVGQGAPCFWRFLDHGNRGLNGCSISIELLPEPKEEHDALNICMRCEKVGNAAGTEIVEVMDEVFCVGCIAAAMQTKQDPRPQPHGECDACSKEADLIEVIFPNGSSIKACIRCAPLTVAPIG